MFSADNNNDNDDNSKKVQVPTASAAAKPLETVSSDSMALSSSTTPRMMTTTTTNLVKDMNTGEVKQVQWVDPAMAANTNPFNLGWAYVFIILPATLIANDFLHFIDPTGPLGFLTKY
ncbi:hypothetical protein ACA910_004652 [Epithemia clementina (nom. ined.)]